MWKKSQFIHIAFSGQLVTSVIYWMTTACKAPGSLLSQPINEADEKSHCGAVLQRETWGEGSGEELDTP